MEPVITKIAGGEVIERKYNDGPIDTQIRIPYAEIERRMNRTNDKFVRIYKDTPTTVALQIFGKRANTGMYGIARLNKEALTALRDAATKLLEFF